MSFRLRSKGTASFIVQETAMTTYSVILPRSEENHQLFREAGLSLSALDTVRAEGSSSGRREVRLGGDPGLSCDRCSGATEMNPGTDLPPLQVP